MRALRYAGTSTARVRRSVLLIHSASANQFPVGTGPILMAATTTDIKSRSDSRSFITLTSSMSTNSILDPPHGTTFSDFMRTWNDVHVARWLADNKCSAHIPAFKDNDIRGDILLELDQDTLKEMGISSIGDRLRIVNGVKSLRSKCSQRATSSLSAIAQTRAFLSSLPPESSREPPADHSHSRTSSQELSTSREPSPTSRTSHKRLDSNRPAPLVLSPTSGRPDLPRIIREPQSGDSIRNPSTIRPLPQISQSTTPTSYTPRPSLPPLPPAPRGQPPQPPRGTSRTLHSVTGPRTRTPNQPDATNYANSPLPPAPTPTPSNMLTTPSQSNSWSFGLPPDPRSGPSPIKSPSPLSSRSSPRSINVAHNRNISFNGVPSPLAPTPTNSKLPPRPSTTGTSAHPYASVQAPPSLQAPAQNGLALSPIVESFQGQTSASSSGSSSPPAFAVGRGPFNPSAHNTPSDTSRRKLVRFSMPEEQRYYTVDVADCAGGIEVMEKVLKKADKVGSSRRNDVMSRVETDDGGLSVDGWSVYLEWDETNDSGLIPLSFKISNSDICGQANHFPKQNS